MIVYPKTREIDGTVFLGPTLSSEVEDGLESWADSNYRTIVDTNEFLDSSRVKRID